MKTYILYNPLAGNGQHDERLNTLKQTAGEGAVCCPVTEIRDYAAFLSDITAEDTIILCGGDGTLNRFVNDTDGLTVPCDILYCAMGSGNDFQKDVGLGADGLPYSVKAFLQDLPTVTVKGKTCHFLNNVGFGIDGYCCEVGDALKISKPGKPVNYTAIAIKGLLFHFKPRNAVVTVDGVEYRYKKVWLAPTMKGRYYGGGMMAAPAQDRSAVDGKLSIMLFHGKGRLLTLMAFPSIFTGEHINKKNVVALHEGKEIKVVFDAPTALQIDGETILDVTEYKAMAKVPAAVSL